MTLVRKLQQQVRRYILILTRGRPYVAEWDAMVAALADKAVSNKALGPLVGLTFILVKAYQDTWTRRAEDAFSVPSAKVIDIAFKSSICHFAASLTAEPRTNESLTLPAVSEYIHTFWTLHPDRSNPMSADEISAMIQTCAILLQKDPSTSMPLKLGMLIVGTNVITATYAGMLILDMILTTSHEFEAIQIHGLDKNISVELNPDVSFDGTDQDKISSWTKKCRQGMDAF